MVHSFASLYFFFLKSICPLSCGTMEEVSPCHQTEGFHPQHSVSKNPKNL